MMTIPVFVLCLALLGSANGGRKWRRLAQETMDEREKELDHIKQELSAISRQMMLQQFFNEERVRSEGSSGLKQIRVHQTGPRTYHSETHTGGSMAAMHNHANNIRTVGLGEFVAVINGIEFRTRHNDYRLFMPSTTSKDFHATEPIPFPDVPPEVSKLQNLDAQINEMREWFKAWRDQDHSKRDYRKYFKPTLCYLEGAWTTSGDKIDEPFDSDRHFIDAKNWQELQDRIRFTSYTGSKSRLENLAFLPTKLMRFVNDTVPVFAQWNYRILCYPLKNDVPLKKLRLVDDLAGRMAHRRTIEKHRFSRAARFILDPDMDENKLSDRMHNGRTYLDTLMEQIPGKDNIGTLNDLGLDGTDPALDMTTGKPLNVAKYNRWFKVGRRDAMGLQGVHRTFSDEAVFAAMTTQDRIAGLDIENRRKCKWDRVLRKRVCEKVHQKWSYAIPLEIIFLTPLSKWNPYNLQYKGDASGAGKEASFGKNGNCKDKTLMYNGTNSKAFFQTPNEFYSGSTMSADSADTGRGAACVLDSKGESKMVRPSGTYVMLPFIKGIGTLRQRYPIMPVHGEGSSVWKELDAVKDMVLNPKMFEHMRWDSTTEVQQDLEIETGVSSSTNKAITPHTHTILLSPGDVQQLKGGVTLTRETSVASGHSHEMMIRYDDKKKQFYYLKCGGAWTCRDGHYKYFTVAEDNAA